ncbi:MAG TPA: APC family permease [Pseudomonadota bacterium]|nr:APC family permease [Pseudomonadota bacterium]
MNPARPNDTSLYGDAALIRAVGFFALTAAVINVIVGGGIFRLPASLGANLGASAPLAFLLGAAAILPIALCFAAAGSRVASSGGPYSYVDAAFGPLPGFVAGALMWICNIASSAGVAAALADQAGQAWPLLQGTGARSAFLIAVYLLLIALNAHGVQLGARAIVTLATLKLAPLFLLAGVGLCVVDHGRIAWTTWPSWDALGVSMVMVMFAYSGAETALIPGGEVRDPARDVPRATLAATALVILLYVSIQVVAQGLLGPALPASTAPLADAAGAIWAPGRTLLLITAGVSMLGFLMGNLLGTSRVVFALGRDGVLPRALGRVSATHRVPFAAVLVHGGLACVLALAGNFEFLVIVSAGANCIVYVGVSAAAWQLQRSGRAERGTPFRLPGGALIPALAVLAMIAILATLRRAEWAAIGVSLGLLVAIHLLQRRFGGPTTQRDSR